MELTETIKTQRDRLQMLRSEKERALKNGLPERGYKRFDDYMDMLTCNIVSCEDGIANLEEELEKQNGGVVSERFENQTFSNFDSKNRERVFGICKRYAESVVKGEKKSLVIAGAVGTGKTHLASAIAQECMSHGMVVKFGNVTDIFQSLKNAFTKDEDVLTEVKSVPFLVLDDLGKENNSDWARETIYSIVNYRYEHMLPMVITTNLTLDEMQDRLGDATVSRMAQMCDYVETEGEDYRMGAK